MYFDNLSQQEQDLAAVELETALTDLGVDIEDEDKLRTSSWIYFIYLDEKSETTQNFIKMKHPAQLLYESRPSSRVSITNSDMELLLESGLLERTLWPDLINDPNVFIGIDCNHDVNGAVLGTPFEASLALYGGPVIGSYEFMPTEGYGYGWESVDENWTLLGGDWLDIDFFKPTPEAAVKCAREIEFNDEYRKFSLDHHVTSLLARGDAKDFDRLVKGVNPSIYQACLDTWEDATNFESQSWADYYGQKPIVHLDRIQQTRWSKISSESRVLIVNALTDNLATEGVSDFIAAIAYNSATSDEVATSLKSLDIEVINAALHARMMSKGIFPRIPS
jgi:hypothetical protein